MYSTGQLVRGLKDPRLVGRELNRLYYTQGYRRAHNPKGSNILDEDWDNLVILDACRYDTFSKQADLPGRLEHRYSLGSATYEFVRANFSNRELFGTVYVGANTWFLKLKEEIDADIHDFINLQSGNHDVTWVDEELKVVTPETVTQHAKRIHDKYPNKRLIIHYLQPHHPFIGPTGRKHLTHQSNSLTKVVEEAGSSVDRTIIQKAYLENFQKVVSTVKDLLPKLTGKTVITADHGEMLGDRHDVFPTRDYGHPAKIYNESTVKVPWNVIEAQPRKRIIEESPTTEQNSDMGKINEQLRDLGYAI